MSVRRVLSLSALRTTFDQRARQDGTNGLRENALRGEPLLAAVSEAMVSMHERYHGRAPATAKSLMMGDDLLACVLGGVYKDVEKTMIEAQHTTVVQRTRSAFQEAMQQKFIQTVERLSGRRVLAFISNQHVGPDLEIELFVLPPKGHDPPRLASTPAGIGARVPSTGGHTRRSSDRRVRAGEAASDS